jgi:hypothetical protein
MAGWLTNRYMARSFPGSTLHFGKASRTLPIIARLFAASGSIPTFPWSGTDDKDPRVAGLYIVLDDVARSSPVCDLNKQQRTDLAVLIQGCQDVLNTFDTILQKQGVLEGKCSGFRSKSKRAWERLKWDQGEISELRNRLVSKTTLLDAFNSSISRFGADFC